MQLTKLWSDKLTYWVAVVESRKYVLCTARYSDNLGDGVIGDCVEFLIKSLRPGAVVTHIDIAGRESYGKATLRPSATKRLFNLAPRPVRPLLTLLAWPVIFRPKLSAMLARNSEPDASLIYGGGQLLSDLALNFPLKIRFINKWHSGRRVAFHAVGVSGKWSKLGARIVSSALNRADVRFLCVRDPESLEHIRNKLSIEKLPIELTVDPAVHVADVYKLDYVRSHIGDSIRVGVGISDPSELGNYSRDPQAFQPENQLRFWVDLVLALLRAGQVPVLFTNGSLEDEHFLKVVEGKLLSEGVDGWTKCERPKTPRELVQSISTFDRLVSHRLHANIIAFGLGVPSVAIVWDDKVLSFFKIAGTENRCFGPRVDATEVANGIIALPGRNFDSSDRLAQLKSMSLNSFLRMLQALEA